MALWENVIGYGAHADRPAPGAQGALYFESDTANGYRDNGVSWDLIVSAPVAGGLAPIAATTLSAAAATIPFAAIAGTYRVLRLYLEGRGDTSGTSIDVELTLNGDTDLDYNSQVIDAYASTVEAGTYANTAAFFPGQIPAADAPSSYSGGFTLELPFYAATAFYKRMISETACLQASGDTLVQVVYGSWHKTEAITDLVLAPSAGNFAAGTTALLYGLS